MGRGQRRERGFVYWGCEEMKGFGAEGRRCCEDQLINQNGGEQRELFSQLKEAKPVGRGLGSILRRPLYKSTFSLAHAPPFCAPVPLDTCLMRRRRQQTSPVPCVVRSDET
jgi:hypothetical protein